MIGRDRVRGSAAGQARGTHGVYIRAASRWDTPEGTVGHQDRTVLGACLGLAWMRAFHHVPGRPPSRVHRQVYIPHGETVKVKKSANRRRRAESPFPPGGSGGSIALNELGVGRSLSVRDGRSCAAIGAPSFHRPGGGNVPLNSTLKGHASARQTRSGPVRCILGGGEA